MRLLSGEAGVRFIGGAMDNKEFFQRVKTCEAKYGANESVRFVIFSTKNGLYLGVVVYVHRQLKLGDQSSTLDVKHFPADNEQKAVEECEKWIKENIEEDVSINCVDK